jgi:hypothetical protein
VRFAQEELAEECLLHDQVVRDIVEERFGLEDWDVATNPELMGPAAPDIVARHSVQVVAIGEVETASTLCHERAKLWKAFGQSCPRFYLYVPEGSEEETARLIANHQVACAGLRSYSYNGKLTVKSVRLEGARCREDDHPWWVAIGGGDRIC